MKLKIIVLLAFIMVTLTSCPDDIIEFEIIGWEPKDFPDMNLSLTDIYFADSLKGWLTASYFRSNDMDKNYASIYFTSDGGKNWEEQKKDLKNYFYRLKFINENTGFVLGKEGTLYRTSDGGKNWDLVKINNPENDSLGAFRGITFVDSNIGWIVGTYGTVLKTTDGGMNWTKVEFFTFLHLLDVKFFDSNNGIVVGGEDLNGYTTGNILKTTDGGTTWTEVHKKNSALFRDCEVISSTTAFASGDNGYFVKTNDAGSSWFKIELNEDSHLNSVFFADENNGWVCGYHGSLYYTSDGGNIWKIQETDRRENFYQMYFLDVKHGWLVGAYGTLLYTYNSGIDVIKK